MKTVFKAIFLVALCTFLVVGTSSALTYSNNITIWDEDGYLGINAGGEDNETEPGTIANQSWDLEAWYFDKNTADLTGVGGFDFKNGNSGWASGDVFIAIGNAPEYGEGVHKSSYTGSGNDPTTHDFGYSFVYDMNWAAGTYDIVILDKNLNGNVDTFIDVYYSINTGSNPYAYSSGGAYLSSGNFGYATGLGDAAVGGLDGTWNGGAVGHNAFSLDLSPILALFPDADFDFWVHLTQECGNDNLMGKETYEGGTVSEPSTLALVGLGLLGLAGLGRKRFQKK